MRVLFTTSAWPTHYFSMIPLGWALQAAGDEVRVACAESQVSTVTHAGLAPVAIMDGLEMMFAARFGRYRDVLGAGGTYRPGSVLHPVTAEPLERLEDFDVADHHQRFFRSYYEKMKDSCDRVAEFARWWRPDLVVFDPVNIEGVLAARLLGVPAVCHLWGFVGTHETAPGQDIVALDHTGSFARHGLPPMSADLIDHVLDPCPASVAPVTTANRLPIRYVPYNGVGSGPVWALRPPASGRPRILVTWSTVLSHLYGPDSSQVAKVIEAVAELDAEIVVAGKQTDLDLLGPALPDNVRPLISCPLHLVLPTCDAVVHHGGAGTAMTAIVAGVPQLMLTIAWEHDLPADRAVSTGNGFRENGHSATAELIRERVRALLDQPAFAKSADALRAEALDRPTPARMVSTLHELAARS